MKHDLLKKTSMRLLVSLAGAVFMFTSCIAERWDDCPPNVRLVVKTDYERNLPSRTPAAEDWYRDQIKSVTVFVFDENDNYVISWTGGEYQLGGSDYVIPINIPAGKNYRYVAWTNAVTDHYWFSHEGGELTRSVNRSDMNIRLEHPAGKIFREDIPHRHHGALESTKAYENNTTTEEVIVITPHTYKLNFVLKGLPQGSRYDVTVDDSNTHHDFITASDIPSMREEYSHIRTFARDPEAGNLSRTEIGASMVLLQIGDDTGTSFTLSNESSGSDFLSADLLETIAEAYATQLDQDYDGDLQKMLLNKYEYTLVFELAGLGVNVELKPWDYRDNGGNLNR